MCISAYIGKFMKTSPQNKIEKIAAPKGSAIGLAEEAGIQNSFVQLVARDRNLLIIHRERSIKVCAKTRHYSHVVMISSSKNL